MKKIVLLSPLLFLVACIAKKQTIIVAPPTRTPLTMLKTPGNPSMEDTRENALATYIMVTITGLRAQYVDEVEQETATHKWLEKKGGTLVLMKEGALEPILIKTFDLHPDQDKVQARALARASARIQKLMGDMGYEVGKGCAKSCHN